MAFKIVTISDTHGKHRQIKIPDGDILIHAGDITSYGEIATLIDFNKWMGELPHKHKFVIFGNHDKFESNLDVAKSILTNCTHLHDSEADCEGLKIWGSPWSSRFGHDWAWNVDRGKDSAELYSRIPDDTDILITHGPAFGRGDRLAYPNLDGRVNAGCDDLLERVEVVKPKLHVVGHIHESRGTAGCSWGDGSHTLFVNASSLTLRYMPYDEQAIVVTI